MNNLQSPFNQLLLYFLLLITVSTIFIGCGEQPTTPAEWPAVTTTSKPWTRWWWHGSAVTSQDLSGNLQKYHDAGLGGVEITPIYGVKGYEDQFIDFLSPQWMELLQHTVHEARRFNMQVDMATGTGWPFGGPHISPEYAAPRLVTETFHLSAGEQISEPIRHISEPFNQPAPLQAVMAYSENEDIRDLTANVTDKGYLQWTPSTGEWELIAVFQGWTGQQVKRAAPGGEGNVLDHYSVDALHHYLSRFDSAFRSYEENLIRAYFNDSFEVYGSNWTGDIFTEFRTRRGYDLRNHLPPLLGRGPNEIASRVKSDYHETIFELLLKEFTVPWRDWAHQNGSIVRNQAHGSPGNLLDLYGAVDIPETETIFPVQYNIPGYHTHPDFVDVPEQPHPLIMKFASSAAHVTGKQLVSSETATWLDEHFKVALSQVKPEVDELYTAGINHIIYHGTAYSPLEETWPGWLFYASTHFGPTNTWWEDFKALNDYIAHTQAFLQQGAPANDILMYFPIYDAWHQAEEDFLRFSVHNYPDWFAGTPIHQAAQYLWDQGYTFDYISDRQLRDVAFTGNELATGGAGYQTLLLPASEHMPIGTLREIIRLADAGATVLVHQHLPSTVPGLGDLQQREGALHRLLDSLQFRPSDQAGLSVAEVGNGSVVVGNDLSQLLRVTSAAREPLVDHNLKFIRLSHPDGMVYFVTNLESQAVDAWIPLGTEAQSALIFDPLRMRRGLADIRQQGNNGTAVRLQIRPGESRILKTFREGNITGPQWPYLGDRIASREITGRWELEFVKGGPALPEPATISELTSWTELPGDAVKNFAGTARYSITFSGPDVEAEEWVLDLGEVAESARVTLNGRELGPVFSHPFRIRIGDAIQSGENTLTLEVTNLMANRIAYMDHQDITWKKFYEINFVNIHYEPFDASQWTPMESGLLGPVRLIAYGSR